MQTQDEIGALFARLAIADDEFCNILLGTIERLNKENPSALLPEDVVNLAEWVQFMRCLRNCLSNR